MTCLGLSFGCGHVMLLRMKKPKPTSAPTDFLARHPKVAAVEAFVVDINGVARGKRLPRAGADKIFKGAFRLPRSSFAFDIWGQDVIGAGLVAETGDCDGVCHLVEGRAHLMPASTKTAGLTAQALMSMYDPAGKPFFADPRHVLGRVLADYAKAGLTPVVALELEFYLVDAMPDEGGRPQPPRSPKSGRRAHQAQTYGLAEVADFSAVLNEIETTAAAMGLPADGLLSENGPAQYEINLKHCRDALAAADDAILLKRAIKAVAARHGMMASFMAKPYAARSGSGMHVHVSVLDRHDVNIFAGANDKGSPALRHAVAGILAALPDSTAVLAPHANSYRRFRVGSHAPTTLTWGYDNRSAAVRVPESTPAATRIEHRVAGADANPYLVVAVILAALLEGLKAKKAPPPALNGNAYQAKAKSLPRRWDEALEIFAQSAFIDRAFGKAFKKVFLACKRQEIDLIEAEVSSVEHDAYLRDS